MLSILQTNTVNDKIDTTIKVISETKDSLLVHVLDTAGKTQVEKGLYEAVQTITSTPIDELLKNLMSSGINFGLKLLAAFLIYSVGAWLIKIIKKAVLRSLQRKNADAEIQSFLMSFLSIMLSIILIIITVGTLGVETTSLAALLAAGGMAIGMALSGTVQNFAGGLMIIVFRPFRIGDLISAQGYLGTVKDISITSTKILTPDNRTIILPNGPLSNGSIDNYSTQKFRRVEWNVDVEYGSDAAQVKSLLRTLVETDERILSVAKGAPGDILVELLSLKDSSVCFVVRGWVKSEDYWDVTFSMNEKIYTELPKNGIQFPFPQLDVKIKN